MAEVAPQLARHPVGHGVERLLFDWWGALAPEVHWAWLALDGLAYGAFLGAAITLLFQAFARGRRDFASARSLAAARYDVVVPRADRAKALDILGTPS